MKKEKLISSQSHSELFLSAFFRDKNKLIENIDIKIKINAPKEYIWVMGGVVEISPREILLMHRDAFYGFTKYIDTYNNIIEDMKFLGIHFDEEVDYYKFFNVVSTFFEDEEWFDKNDFIEFLKKGYRKIDLLLVNYAFKRKREVVEKLLLSGANPFINPEDNTESSVLELLETESSFNGINYYGSLNCGMENIKINDREIYHLLEGIVAVASSERIIRCIKSYYKEDLIKNTNAFFTTLLSEKEIDQMVHDLFGLNID